MTELIVALDLNSFKEAKNIVKILYPKVKIFKVGLRLFTAEGPKVVDWLVKNKIKVFLDLKLYDIPITMKETVRLFCKMNIFMFTVHIQVGKNSLIQLKDTLFSESQSLKIKRPLMIGVTVLTSQKSEPKEIINLIKTAKEVGLDGVVASVKDLEFIPKDIRRGLIIVSPGIRIDKFPGDDQKRIATPSEAKKKKVNYIVVGRPILEAINPLEKVEYILRELRCL